jgi:hypothetical protein
MSGDNDPMDADEFNSIYFPKGDKAESREGKKISAEVYKLSMFAIRQALELMADAPAEHVSIELQEQFGELAEAKHIDLMKFAKLVDDAVKSKKLSAYASVTLIEALTLYTALLMDDDHPDVKLLEARAVEEKKEIEAEKRKKLH